MSRNRSLLGFEDSIVVPKMQNSDMQHMENTTKSKTTLQVNSMMDINGGEGMTIRARGMRVGGLIAGIILTVLGALTLAEAIITLMGNPAFIFIDNMNRTFELVVGLVTIIVAGSTMDVSRA